MKFFGILLTFWIGLSGPVAGASPIGEAFQEYQAALARGDIIKADEAGERAWHLAEEAGKHKNAAVLAYNLAELRLRYSPASDAVTPAKRAAELVAGIENPSVPGVKVQMLNALMIYKDDDSFSNAKNLQSKVDIFAESNLEIDYAFFLSTTLLMQEQHSRKRWKSARKYAQFALNSMQNLDLKNAQVEATIRMHLGSAILLDDNENGLDEARNQFLAAMELAGDFRFDNVPDFYWRAKAWNSAIGSVHMTRDGANDKSKEEKETAEKEYALEREQNNVREQRPANCPAIKWVTRKPPKFPRGLLEKGFIGAAIVKYDIEEDGRLSNVVLAAEVPSFAFGKYAVKQVKKWRAKPMRGVSDGCRTHLYSTFSFAIHS